MLAYFDCFSGISGDMTLGAFISLGVPVEWLNGELQRLPLPDVEVVTRPVSRHGISAQQVQVVVKDASVSRNYSQIRQLIQNSPLGDAVKKNSLAVFEKLAEAEAGIHGRPKGKVHFHEIGGADAIADIVGSALCVEYLGIDRIVSSKIPLGRGIVNCSHGTIPVPAPATVAVLKNIPVYGVELDHEIVTPTGAALIATLADAFGEIPAMRIDRVGYGAGQHEFEALPNLLRIMIGINHPDDSQPTGGGRRETIGVLETCVDDMNPEHIGFMMDRLYEDGALEVYLLPIFTKKNRPGTLVQVLGRIEQLEKLMQRLLAESTSLGVRYHHTTRLTLEREMVTVESPFGAIRVKQITDLGGEKRIVPEYEVCRKIAIESRLPLRSVYEAILKGACGLP